MKETRTGDVRLHRARAALAGRRSRIRRGTLRVRARRFLVVGLPVRAVVDAAAPDVAGVRLLCRDLGRSRDSGSDIWCARGRCWPHRPPHFAAGWARGRDLAPLHAGRPRLEKSRCRQRRRSRRRRAALLRCLAAAKKFAVRRTAHANARTCSCGAEPAWAARVRRNRTFPRTRSAAMSVAIVDYGSGNLHSAAKAFERAAHDAGLGQPIVVTKDPAVVASADRVVLPGVGAFADCRRGLDAVDGMVAALDEAVHEKGRPFFGICVGMQLLAERGREYEVTPGLGWIAGEVDRITPDDPHLKIPHMGWNTLNVTRPHKLVEGLALGADGRHAYFVHSYEFKVTERANLVAEADYGGPITAIVARDNLVGTQFHPEKIQKLGLALIANFLTWKP